MHMTYWTEQNTSDDPIDKLISDLQQELQQRLNEHEVILIGLDSNQDLTATNRFTKAMEALSLYNPILELLPPHYGAPPPT